VDHAEEELVKAIAGVIGPLPSRLRIFVRSPPRSHRTARDRHERCRGRRREIGDEERDPLERRAHDVLVAPSSKVDSKERDDTIAFKLERAMFSTEK
jgi:hypothetical protein